MLKEQFVKIDRSPPRTDVANQGTSRFDVLSRDTSLATKPRSIAIKEHAVTDPETGYATASPI